MALTGHLDDYPLTALVKTLRAQRKTGRLQVEYSESPGAFFFEDGLLVDVQLGNLRGLEALHTALSLRGGSFNFNPLLRPPERSVETTQQQFVQSLLSAHEGAAEVLVAGGGAAPPLARGSAPHVPQLAPAGGEAALSLSAGESLAARLALVEEAVSSSSRRFSRERLLYACVIVLLLALTLASALRSGARRSAAEAAPVPVVAGRTAETVKPGPPAAGEARQGPQPEAPAAPHRRDKVREPQRRSQAPSIAQSREAERAIRASGATPSEAVAAPPPAEKAEGTRGDEGRPAAAEQVVQVVMRVEGGRVVEAFVKQPRPELKAYEALALRMARQRRYPEDFSGQDTLRIRAKP